MNTSESGIKLIKQFEGFRAKPYKDIVGIVTCGYGHACFGDEKPPAIMTEQEGDALLRKDLVMFEQGVNAMVKTSITQNQFDALVSFAFNLGLSSLRQSTLLKKLNAGDVSGAKEEFSKWCLAGGKRISGLLTRRLAEADLFGRAT